MRLIAQKVVDYKAVLGPPVQNLKSIGVDFVEQHAAGSPGVAEEQNQMNDAQDWHLKTCDKGKKGIKDIYPRCPAFMRHKNTTLKKQTKSYPANGKTK